jgi:hypothetical protein
MAEAVNHRSVIAEARFQSEIRVGFGGDTVALGQVFLRVLRFYRVSIISPVSKLIHLPVIDAVQAT